MIAVIKTGGKQYIVKEGEELRIEKLDHTEGESAILTEVLLIADEEGDEVTLGTPFIEDAKIEAEVVEQGRGKKVTIIRFKRKVRYRRKRGHRQPFTKVKIGKV